MGRQPRREVRALKLQALELADDGILLQLEPEPDFDEREAEKREPRAAGPEQHVPNLLGVRESPPAERRPKRNIRSHGCFRAIRSAIPAQIDASNRVCSPRGGGSL